MRVTKYEHSCVLVEDGDVRILTDPGELTHGFVNLTGLSAILVTHQHFDHIDLARIVPLLERNPAAALYTDEATASILADRDIRARPARQGDRLDVWFFARWRPGSAAHAGQAARAAPTARSTSSALASANSPRISSVAGLTDCR